MRALFKLADNRDAIVEILEKYNNLFGFKSLFLFNQASDDGPWTFLQTGSGKQIKSDPALKPIPEIESDYLLRSACEDPALENFMDHFNLRIISKISIGNQADYFLLGVETNKKEISDTGKDHVDLLAGHLQNMVNNQFLNAELNKYADRTQKMISELGALHEITRSIESAQNLESLLKYIVSKSMNLMDCEAASLMIVVEGTDELEFKVVLGPKAEEVKPFRVKIGQGISGWVAKHRQPVLIPDAYKDDRFDPSYDKRSGFRTKSYLCVPLIYNNNIQGVISVLNRLDDIPFNDNDQELLTTFGSQAALAIENAKLLQAAIEKERMDKELQVAAQVQYLLLPQEIPQVTDLDISATYIPCREVSGDFYDVIKIDDNRYIFIVADVSGKGVPGAMLVSTMQATLRAYLEYSDDLLTVISRLNEKIIRNTTDDRYITFFMGLYNAKDHSFKYVNAGHNFPLLLQPDGSLKKLSVGGIFLGYRTWEYEMEAVQLDKNSGLFLFTDGLIEAMNGDEEEFGNARLETVILDNQNLSADALKEKIIEQVNQFIDARKLDDDFTLLVAKRK